MRQNIRLYLIYSFFIPEYSRKRTTNSWTLPTRSRT